MAQMTKPLIGSEEGLLSASFKLFETGKTYTAKPGVHTTAAGSFVPLKQPTGRFQVFFFTPTKGLSGYVISDSKLKKMVDAEVGESDEVGTLMLLRALELNKNA